MNNVNVTTKISQYDMKFKNIFLNQNNCVDFKKISYNMLLKICQTNDVLIYMKMKTFEFFFFVLKLKNLSNDVGRLYLCRFKRILISYNFSNSQQGLLKIAKCFFFFF